MNHIYILYIYLYSIFFYHTITKTEGRPQDTHPIAKLPGGLVSRRHRATTSHGWVVETR